MCIAAYFDSTSTVLKEIAKKEKKRPMKENDVVEKAGKWMHFGSQYVPNLQLTRLRVHDWVREWPACGPQVFKHKLIRIHVDRTCTLATKRTSKRKCRAA